MYLKQNLKKRLIRLRTQIDFILCYDEIGQAERVENLLPRIFSLTTLLWGHNYKEYLKRTKDLK